MDNPLIAFFLANVGGNCPRKRKYSSIFALFSVRAFLIFLHASSLDLTEYDPSLFFPKNRPGGDCSLTVL